MKTYSKIFSMPAVILLAGVGCCLVLPGVASAQPGSLSPHALVPERQLVLAPEKRPGWQAAWDRARELTRNGDYDGAIAGFKALLAQKDNLDEARWELVKLQMHLHQWEDAAAGLERLVEKKHGRTAYLNALGRVMWETGQLERAVVLFGQVRSIDPGNQTATAGLIEALIKQGNKQMAYPLLEELFRKDPGNLGVQRYLALFAFEFGDRENARQHLVSLAARQGADPEILRAAALVHEQLGLNNLAVGYWKKLQAREPESLESRVHLASYYAAQGRQHEALPLLEQIDPASVRDIDLLTSIGNLFNSMGKPDEAIAVYRQLQELEPADQSILEEIVRLEAAKGHQEKTLAALDAYIVPREKADPAAMRMAARLYERAGRYHDAIPLYRKLEELFPGDQEILTALADDLLATGDNEGALLLFKRLAGLTPGNLTVYRAMAGLLQRLGRQDELLEIANAIFLIEPDDKDNLLLLAHLNQRAGDLEKAGYFYEQLAGTGQQDAALFEGRAALYRQLQRPEQVYRDLSRLVAIAPERLDARSELITLAGELGFMDTVFENRAVLENRAGRDLEGGDDKTLPVSMVFLVSQALKEGGFYYDAAGLVAGAAASPEAIGKVRERLLLLEAEILQDAGQYYSAEKILREALVAATERQPFLRILFDNSLAAGRHDESRAWLEGLRALAGRAASPELQLLEARLLAAEGEYRDAAGIYRSLLSSQPGLMPVAGQQLSRGQVGLLLARTLYQDDQLVEAEKVARELADQNDNWLAVQVLLQQIHMQAGETVLAQDILNRLVDYAAGDLGMMIRLAELYREYDDLPSLLRIGDETAASAPASIKSRFLQAELLEKTGEMDAALAVAEGILANFPDNSKAEDLAIRLFVRTGKFDQALAGCDTVLAREPGRAGLILVKARIQWARHQWPASRKIYEGFLSPSVEDILERELEKMRVMVPLPPQRTFWNRLTFTSGREPSLAEVVMAPSYLLDRTTDDTSVKRMAASLYDQYRWQERFAAELAARKAVIRREYNHAVLLYNALLADYGADETLLFDLAGVYSRLNRLGEESVIYEEMKSRNPVFPGLDEATARNDLKRKPYLSMRFGQNEADGWEAYKAIRSEWSKLAGWYAPGPQHELELTLTRLRYKALDHSEEVQGNRAELAYRTVFAKAYTLELGAGIQALDDPQPETAVFRAALVGRLGDAWQANISYSRDVTEDTFASLTRNIIKQDYVVGWAVDILPRLFVAGEYDYTDYSDQNWRSRYTARVGYQLFLEPQSLSFGYQYDYLDAGQGQNPGPLLADGFAALDHPYWSPRNYWLNRFTVSFKHQLTANPLSRGVPRYYTIDYTLGYDSRDYDLQSLKAGIFFELTSNVILEASTSFTYQKSYQENNIYLSVTYRLE